ncbi:uncharacterized protein ColSpa_04645 [Colletotrichum spaethianum]|uniref:Secreted protein n=1 Tax=Colletotrichum spaethianum TaxID=700344 RepID=A0AA37P7L0_9PEZI|nr:uncharacterized protein ColSpa_04645 [Colletotrichum spaethianum]GKT44464.1 hypothetical protein ColSpa_04645 [Colletotrichum spaethianum]
MHISAILLTLATAISAAHALCYEGGRSGKYGEWLKGKDTILEEERLSFACTSLVGRGDVKFHAYETRSTCMQQDLRTKWDFTIKRVSDPGGDGTASMTMDNCLEYLRQEAYGCEYGGRIQNWDWDIT